MGVRGSKKRGWKRSNVFRRKVSGRAMSRVFCWLISTKARSVGRRCEMARELSEKYPRNYLFQLQMADASSEIVALRKTKTPVNAEKRRNCRHLHLAVARQNPRSPTRDLIDSRWNITRQQLN